MQSRSASSGKERGPANENGFRGRYRSEAALPFAAFGTRAMGLGQMPSAAACSAAGSLSTTENWMGTVGANGQKSPDFFVGFYS